MLELKFAIYHRAASLPSRASYAVLAEESSIDQTRLSSEERRLIYKYQHKTTIYLNMQWYRFS